MTTSIPVMTWNCSAEFVCCVVWWKQIKVKAAPAVGISGEMFPFSLISSFFYYYLSATGKYTLLLFNAIQCLEASVQWNCSRMNFNWQACCQRVAASPEMYIHSMEMEQLKISIPLCQGLRWMFSRGKRVTFDSVRMDDLWSAWTVYSRWPGAYRIRQLYSLSLYGT